MAASWMTASDLSVCKTPLGESCLSIQFFYSPLTQSVRPPMFTYPSLSCTCVTYKTPCHTIGHQALPTQPLSREAEDIPRAANHSKLMLTHLAWWQPICYNSKFVFKHVKTEKVLLVVKTFIKNIERLPH